jgi:hypothetical protein
VLVGCLVGEHLPFRDIWPCEIGFTNVFACVCVCVCVCVCCYNRCHDIVTNCCWGILVFTGNLPVAMITLLWDAYYEHVPISWPGIHMYFHTMQHSYYNIDIISYSRFRYCNYIIFLNEVNISNDIWFFVIQYCLLLIFISALLQFSEVGFLSSVLDFPVTLDG